MRLALAAVVAVVLFAGGCRVPADDVAMEPADALVVGEGALPAIGPVPQSSHWHAAYVVRICNDVLDPFESDQDPLGIHTHGDGLIHVHPFYEEAGYEDATLSLFADAVGFQLSDGELQLPGGGVWRDGDLCDGVPSRVFVDRWDGPDAASPVVRHFADLGDLRFLADGELYQIAFAPADSPPVVPPSSTQLPEVSELGPAPEPWVDVDVDATLDDVEFWQIATVTAPADSGDCRNGAVPERVLQGPVRCFTTDGEPMAGSDAVVRARAVELNRRPAVEIEMTPALRARFEAHSPISAEPYGLAIVVNGEVVSAPTLARPPVGDRLVVSGGFSTETATQLAAVLSAP